MESIMVKDLVIPSSILGDPKKIKNVVEPLIVSLYNRSLWFTKDSKYRPPFESKAYIDIDTKSFGDNWEVKIVLSNPKSGLWSLRGGLLRYETKSTSEFVAKLVEYVGRYDPAKNNRVPFLLELAGKVTAAADAHANGDKTWGFLMDMKDPYDVITGYNDKLDSEADQFMRIWSDLKKELKTERTISRELGNNALSDLNELIDATYAYHAPLKLEEDVDIDHYYDYPADAIQNYKDIREQLQLMAGALINQAAIIKQRLEDQQN